MTPKINTVISSAHVSWLHWPGLTNKFRSINTGSCDGGNCVKFCILKSVQHSTLARATGTAFWLVDNWPLGLRGMYITPGYTFFSSIEKFSASQPSLARLYSAAASTSERLRSDGSLAIITKCYNSAALFCYLWSLSHRAFPSQNLGTIIKISHD